MGEDPAAWILFYNIGRLLYCRVIAGKNLHIAQASAVLVADYDHAFQSATEAQADACAISYELSAISYELGFQVTGVRFRFD